MVRLCPRCGTQARNGGLVIVSALVMGEVITQGSLTQCNALSPLYS